MREIVRWEHSKRALWLSAACAAGTLPYVFHSYFVRYASVIDGKREAFSPSFLLTTATGVDIPLYGLIARDICLIFLAYYLCSLCGFSWGKKGDHPGLGSVKKVREELLFLFRSAFCVDVILYTVLDRWLTVAHPNLYPSDVLGVLVFMVKSACFEEVVFRFGFLTLIYRLYPNRHAAVWVSSFLYAVAAVKTFTFMGLDYGLNYLTVISFVSRFLSGLLLGYVYMLWGLLPVMVFRMFIGARLFFLI